MSGYTLAPVPGQTFLDNAGRIMPGGKLYTYLSGTSTPNPTYTSATGLQANTNPIVFDGYGRPPQDIFLPVGVSQKWVLTDPDGVILRTYPVVEAVPQQASNVDIAGVAAEPFALGEVAYLSDGSGGKIAGKWYHADSSQPYSSVSPIIGIATGDIATNAGGIFRVSGQAPTHGPVVPGTIYYVGTAGALTATPPTPNRRAVGQADTTGTIVLGNVSPSVSAAELIASLPCEGRISVATSNPVAEGTGGTVYYAPYIGNRIALYDGSVWNIRKFAETPYAMSSLTPSVPFDLFARDNAGVLALEAVQWTSATARAADPVRFDGVLVKSGDATRRYLGTVMIDGSRNTADNDLKRYIFNYYNRIRRSVRVWETTPSWPYTLGLRYANGNAGNRIEVMVGIAGEASIDLTANGISWQSNTSVARMTAIGEDAIAVTAGSLTGIASFSGSATWGVSSTAHLNKVPGIGFHFYAWCEASEAAGTTTWLGNAGGVQSGMTGTWWC